VVHRIGDDEVCDLAHTQPDQGPQDQQRCENAAGSPTAVAHHRQSKPQQKPEWNQRQRHLPSEHGLHERVPTTKGLRDKPADQTNHGAYRGTPQSGGPVAPA
jgi:hypothetical protein